MESSTSRRPSSSPTRLERSRQELNGILADERFDRPTCLLQLQGWRGAELADAIAAGNAHRLAPGSCAIGGFAVAATGSWVLAVVLMTTAVAGIFARNHPVEWLYNRLAPSIGRMPIPRNRAAKQLGCLLGTAFFGVSALSTVLGASLLGQAIAGTFGVVAGFVAVTNICVPSAIFVALFGSDRSTAGKLV